MKFGGHETFPIREGWLYKGLKLLTSDPARICGDEAGDWLGVGRNMAKSIRHWLVATELAQPSGRQGKTLKHPLKPTELAQLVWKSDPYFEDVGTWWALHINLVTNKDHAAIWGWFFNVFPGHRFERAVCVEAAERHLERAGSRMPSRGTLQRDVACLLTSYARVIPEERDDPEDNLECPLTDLGILTYFKGTGVYEMNRRRKPLTPELLGYSISRAVGVQDLGRPAEFTLSELWTLENGPARVFSLSNDSFFDTVLETAQTDQGKGLQIFGLAGERLLRVTSRNPIDWLRAHYDRPENVPAEVAV